MAKHLLIGVNNGQFVLIQHYISYTKWHVAVHMCYVSSYN